MVRLEICTCSSTCFTRVATWGIHGNENGVLIVSAVESIRDTIFGTQCEADNMWPSSVDRKTRAQSHIDCLAVRLFYYSVFQRSPYTDHFDVQKQIPYKLDRIKVIILSVFGGLSCLPLFIFNENIRPDVTVYGRRFTRRV